MSSLIASHKKATGLDSAFRYAKKSPDNQHSSGIQNLSRPAQVAGNLATERFLRSSESSATLRVNPPGDVHEKEADDLAEQVTQTSKGSLAHQERLKNESNPSGGSFFSELPFPLSSGQPLDDASRAFFEPRLGADLSQIRVHTGTAAAAAAEALDAEAFTIGSHVAFGANRYQPASPTGQRLLGHELAHAIQQTSRFNRSPSNRVTTQTGTANVIQRQPVPEMMLTDPVSFIESQLKLRFTDPDDPRLSVRVRRLQEAFGKLTISEARRILEHLRDPPNELAINFQRLATASRNRLRAILLKSLPAEIEGKTLGWLGSAWAYTVIVPLQAQIEVVPSTEEERMFPGYADQDEARDAVIRRPNICAIVRDEKLGRVRAFDTGLPSVVGVPGLGVVNESAPDFTVLEWVSLEGQAAAGIQTRGARILKARALLDAYIKKYGYTFFPPAQVGKVASVDPVQQAALKQVEDAYEELFAEALPFAKGHFNFGFEFQPTGQSGELTTSKPGSINIELFDPWVHGRQKMLDPIEDLNYPGTHRRVQFKKAMEEEFALPPEPYVALTVGAIEEEPLETRRTLLHERAHLAHAERAMKLIEDWKGSGSSMSFEDWVVDQLKKRKISSLDAILAIERAKQKPTSLAFNTEVLGEVEGFMGVYHAEPPVKNLALERLPVLVNMWLNANPEVQELSIRKLHHYYSRMLDQTHRNNFDEYVMEKLFNNPSDPRAQFYQRLIEFSAIP